MKKIISFALSVLSAICICLAFTACNDVDTTNLDAEELSYTEITKQGEVVGYSVSGLGDVTDTDIIIPSTYKGLPVTAISERAFDFEDITSISLPESITKIGYNAFLWCKYLTEITIPDSVTEIGNGAFTNCEALRIVQLPSYIDNISKYTFLNCLALEEINIPITVTRINDYAFDGCYRLKKVYYAGTPEDFEKIIFGPYSKRLSSSLIVYI